MNDDKEGWVPGCTFDDNLLLFKSDAANNVESKMIYQINLKNPTDHRRTPMSSNGLQVIPMDTFYGHFRTKESKTPEPVKTLNTVHHVIMSMADIRIKGVMRIRIKNVIISQQLNSGPYIPKLASLNAQKSL
ncbi:hypothetical protein B9Z55_022642 [Caenorhabditis nigoni]|uniref:Uncharacterized protein n=1 Tax=Caenorhabditis nigoni TaxID=1611254 RepID=A0A2G5SLU5_9PELO|nr:hypothetical protein B9Z55_022642 [Caenorhabditis nigoni]